MAYELHEVLDTVRMTASEHFDIRTVTLGVSLLDCSNASPEVVSQNAYEKVLHTAAHQVHVADEIESLYGIRIANRRVAVTPVTLMGGSFEAGDFIRLANSLDAAANEIGIDFLAGFSALVSRGMHKADHAYMEALPEALASTRHLCASVNCASTTAGINVDAVVRMSHVLRQTAERTAGTDSSGCTRLVTFCNAVPDNPFIAGAFHGPSLGEAVLNVGISGPGVVLRAVRDLPLTGDLSSVCEEVKRTAFKITRAGELIGRQVARRLQARSGVPISFGIVDLSLAPTPQERDSVGAILLAMGLEEVGAPGTTAALAMLTDSIKKGGTMASSRTGGLSGAFIPVSEDSVLARAMDSGQLSMAKLEAMTAVCSVGLDMIALPGDTSTDYLAGIMLDEFAIGMMNNKTTACRLIPVAGKSAGDFAHWGGLLGSAPIVAVPEAPSHALVKRGGHIPAPIRSLTN